METVIVVLGSSELRERLSRAADAARLSRHPTLRHVRHVLFCGHNGEASEMAEVARQHGLRAGVEPLLEHESSNTLENVMHARQMLRDVGYDLARTRVVVLTCLYHLPRAWMTARATFECVVPYVVYMPRLPSRGEVDLFWNREALKIVRYSRRGHLFPASRVARFLRAA